MAKEDIENTQDSNAIGFVVQCPCSPASYIAEVLRKDQAAVDELKTLVPEYTPPTEYTALHARGKEALETLDEMTSLLRSAICICERHGSATNWEGFAASIRKLGLSGVTARTYRQANEAALHRPHEVGSVARAGSSAERMDQTAATEEPPRSSAKRMNDQGMP